MTIAPKKKSETAPPERVIKRDAAASKKRILAAALKEFSSFGLAGARIDRIAARASVSKPMIYSYFGNKEELYAVVLREAYIQIREGERKLDLEKLDPEAAIVELLRFTAYHFRDNPWFLRLLNTENQRRGQTIAKMEGLAELNSPLVGFLSKIIKKGELLFEIDARSYQLRVEQAEAEIKRLNAELDRRQEEKSSLETRLALAEELCRQAKKNVEREQGLVETGAVPQVDLEVPRVDAGHHIPSLHHVAHVHGAGDERSVHPERQVNLLGRLGPPREATPLQPLDVGDLSGPDRPDDGPLGLRLTAAHQGRRHQD